MLPYCKLKIFAQKTYKIWPYAADYAFGLYILSEIPFIYFIDNVLLLQ